MPNPIAIFLLLISQLAVEQQPASTTRSHQRDVSPEAVMHPLQFQTDFSKPDAIKNWEFTDPSAWRIAKTPEGSALELSGKSNYSPKYRSPLNIAMIAGQSFGDFVMEVEAQSTVKPYGHQDLCFFFGFQSPERFYYAHLAVKPDPHAHNIFLVKDAPRLAIAKKTTGGVTWKENAWHKVRIERKLSEDSIKVFFDDMSQPVMVAVDKTHGAGGIGLGSFDDKGRFRNLKIWAREVIGKEGPWFPGKK